MLKTREKIICCIVAAILFLAGMCLETAETDSSFLYITSAHSDATLSSVSYLSENIDSCTSEMLGKGNSMSLRSETGRNVVRWDRTILLSIIVGAILQYLLYFHSTVYGEYYQILRSSTVAVNFIHHKDGEK